MISSESPRVPDDKKAGKTKDDYREVDHLRTELEQELTRLKSQFQRQTEEEKLIEQEREELRRERDDLFKDVSKSKPRALTAVIDPFGGDEVDEGGLPDISGPIDSPGPKPHQKSSKSDQKLEAETVSGTEDPMSGKAPDTDIEARTAMLRKKLGKGPVGPGTTAPDSAGLVAAESRSDSSQTAQPTAVEDYTGTAVAPGIPTDITIDRLKERLESEFGGRLVQQDALLEDLQATLTNHEEVILKVEEIISKLALEKSVEILRKDIHKVETKTNEMAEEVGFGESLNVSKIPPTILESVYEATLSDAIQALIHNKGPYDAEALVIHIIEDIRTQTSGSELFKYEDGRLKIKDLAKNLESKAISAKQIQATYSEILKKIMEHVPGYKPKNFRAMLKIKSQEFAVDRASGLSEILKELRQDVSEIKSVFDSLNERLLELEDSRNTLMNDVRVIEQKLNELENEKDSESGEPEPPDDSSESED